MDRKHYIYIRTIAEEQSFSRAAQKLFISQPSLSQYVHRIEQRYGVPLFERSSNTVKLTPAGEIYLQEAGVILALEEAEIQYVHETEQLQHGRLRIGVAHYRDCLFLPPVIQCFNRQYPGIHIILDEMKQNETERALVEGKLDLAISMPPLQMRGFQFQPLIADTFLLAIAKDHWYLKVNDVHIQQEDDGYPTIHLADMAQCNFIILSPGRTLWNMQQKICESAGFVPKVILETKGVESVHAMAAAGLGATFLPESFLRFSKVKKGLAYFRLDVEEPVIHIGILQLQKRHPSAPAQKFIAMLHTYLEGEACRDVQTV